jgi:putative methylase
MMRKKSLGIILSKLALRPQTKLKWEGYTLDTKSAVDIVFIAASINDDIHKKKVVDLGCGSGILAIAASLLGASKILGVDIDKQAIEVARMNTKKVKAVISLVVGDIECIIGSFDTTLMNPPFGSWTRGMDIRFLKKALKISNVVYSLHKRSESVRVFLSKKIPKIGGSITKVYEININISKTLKFHKKERYLVKADLYRIISTRSCVQKS